MSIFDALALPSPWRPNNQVVVIFLCLPLAHCGGHQFGDDCFRLFRMADTNNNTFYYFIRHEVISCTLIAGGFAIYRSRPAALSGWLVLAFVRTFVGFNYRHWSK